MELVFPWMLYIGIPVVLILPFLGFKRRDKFTKGNKVANTGFIEETDLYKKLMNRYKIFSAVALLFLLVAIGVSFVLMARPSKIETITRENRNRDIFLCMDISSSVDELNLAMCDEIRGVIKDLEGERVGISIFNAKSVLMVPLTTDYEYVLEIIDNLEASFEESFIMYDYYYGDGNYTYEDVANIDYDLYNYKYEGTLSDEGSSFIGDGLASCLYSFPDMEEDPDRTRLIIFTTDNELNGTPLVTVDEATDLCKKHNVKVFAVAPENAVDEENFKSNIEKTGGKYYRNTTPGAFDDLVKEIKKTEASVIVETKLLFYDQPQALFIVLVAVLGVYFVISRKVKL